MGWHCDNCGSTSAYSAQGFMATCNVCGMAEGNTPWAARHETPEQQEQRIARKKASVAGLIEAMDEMKP
jgi:uncharacterized membrane protein YvbJ